MADWTFFWIFWRLDSPSNAHTHRHICVIHAGGYAVPIRSLPGMIFGSFKSLSTLNSLSFFQFQARSWSSLKMLFLITFDLLIWDNSPLFGIPSVSNIIISTLLSGMVWFSLSFTNMFTALSTASLMLVAGGKQCRNQINVNMIVIKQRKGCSHWSLKQ